MVKNFMIFLKNIFFVFKGFRGVFRQKGDIWYKKNILKLKGGVHDDFGVPYHHFFMNFWNVNFDKEFRRFETKRGSFVRKKYFL